MQEPEITDAPERKFVGMRITTYNAENRTFELWRGFKPRVREIERRLNDEFVSIQIFARGHDFSTFTPHTKFEKWAAVEVNDFENVPEGLETLTISSGLYAVFIHRGLPQDFPQTNAFIHGNWFPSSAFALDERPHFEIMGPNYRADDPDAEEKVWLPVRMKRSSSD